MRSFTLYEMTLTIFILFMLFSISFKSSIFQKTIHYLNQETTLLANYFHLARDTSFTTLYWQNERVCAAGLKFNNNSYQGVVYLAETEDCEFLFQNKKDEFSNTNAFLLEDGSASVNENRLMIKRNFRGTIKVLSNPNCDSSDVFTGPLFLFINPYGDLAFYNNNSLQNIKNVYICLQYNNEKKILQISSFGQIFIKEGR